MVHIHYFLHYRIKSKKKVVADEACVMEKTPSVHYLLGHTYYIHKQSFMSESKSQNNNKFQRSSLIMQNLI